MSGCVCVCVCVWQPTPRTSDVTPSSDPLGSLEGVDSGWLLGLCLRKESNTDEYDISTTR